MACISFALPACLPACLAWCCGVVAGKGKGSKAESGKQQRVSDARRAELFLTHVRESENPCGEAFRALVASINESTRSSSDTYGMKAFDARPKYVLRKLCFSILPVKPR